MEVVNMKNKLPYPSDKNNIDLEDARKEYMKAEKAAIVAKYTLPSKPSKDGYYRVYVEDNKAKSGRRQLSAKTIEELADKIYLHEKGIGGCARKTFSEVYDIYEQERTKYLKDPEKLLSAQNTTGKYRYDYKRYFEGTDFEMMYIDNISKRNLEDIIYYNLKRYDMAKKAFDSMLAIIRQVFKLAYSEYWITENTFLRVDPKKFNGMLITPIDPSKRAYSNEELIKIVAFIREYEQDHPYYFPAYALEMQIILGLRRGEVPPLMWSDIKDGLVYISKEQLTVKKTATEKQHCEIVYHTKTHKNRVIPVSDELESLLARLKNVHNSFHVNSLYLFPANTPTGVISNCVVYKFYDKVVTKLGIKKMDMITGPHSFRRNAITDIANASGGNMTLASQLCGNTPLVAKGNYYTGADMEIARTAMNSRKLS